MGFLLFRRYNIRMIKHRTIALNLTPIDLTWSGVIDPTNTLSIQNTSESGFAYLGGEDVSILNYGHKLYPGQSFTIALSPADKIYAVSDSNISVAVFELDF